MFADFLNSLCVEYEGQLVMKDARIPELYIRI